MLPDRIDILSAAEALDLNAAGAMIRHAPEAAAL
jgi:hypothetical protein